MHDVCHMYPQKIDSIHHSFIHSFIFFLWIRTGLQNPFGYGNSQICLDNLKVGQYNSVQQY
jgi:hypothetical protein